LVAEENALALPEVNKHNVVVPGIKTLHQRPVSEIAEVLANVLRSSPSIVEFRYVIGSHIEITTGS